MDTGEGNPKAIGPFQGHPPGGVSDPQVDYWAGIPHAKQRQSPRYNAHQILPRTDGPLNSLLRRGDTGWVCRVVAPGSTATSLGGQLYR